MAKSYLDTTACNTLVHFLETVFTIENPSPEILLTISGDTQTRHRHFTISDDDEDLRRYKEQEDPELEEGDFSIPSLAERPVSLLIDGETFLQRGPGYAALKTLSDALGPAAMRITLKTGTPQFNFN